MIFYFGEIINQPPMSNSNNNAPPQPPAKRCKFDSIKENDFFSEVQYYKCIDKSQQSVDVQNARGFEFEIAKPIIEEGSWSASQHPKEVKVSRTDCIKKMLHAKADIFTVNFNKKPNADSHSNVLKKATIADITDPKKLRKLSKELEKGQERTLIGHLVEAEPLLGRSKVIDLEEHFRNIERKKRKQPTNHTLKQVDHRHINWLIINGTKYVVRGA